MFQFIANKCLCWTLIWTRKMAKHQNLVCSDSRVKMIVLISSMFDNVKEWKPERNVLMWYMDCVACLALDRIVCFFEVMSCRRSREPSNQSLIHMLYMDHFDWFVSLRDRRRYSPVLYFSWRIMIDRCSMANCEKNIPINSSNIY